jgi:uncharacterized protein (UPF0332 family)
VDNYSITDLAYFRIDQARECLEASEALIDINHCKDAANRSYYCIFHSMRAVLALDGYDSKKHSGIISEFRKSYIKTGKFSVNFSETIKDAFDVRTDSDYQDFYAISKEDVQQQIDNAREFLQAVQEYIDNYTRNEHNK